MTPTEIETAARRRYNAVGDTNWSSQEIIDLMYHASLEISRDCGILIEKKFLGSTVVGTREYSFPNQANAIKRITYDGKKLQEYSMREDDALTMENQLSTSTGTPEFYYVWNRTINLRPIPDSVKSLEIFAECYEQPLTVASVIDLPERFHGSLITYVIKEMAAKDLNWNMFDRFSARLEEEKMKIRAALKREKRADSFKIVTNEELVPFTSIGPK